VGTGDDPAKCRLAGSVLSDERVDRAALDREGDLLKSLDAGEALADAD
jgi:hypothetical protein